MPWRELLIVAILLGLLCVVAVIGTQLLWRPLPPPIAASRSRLELPVVVDNPLHRWGLPGPALEDSSFATGVPGPQKFSPWALQYLNDSRLAGDASATLNFRADTRVPAFNRASLEDYSGTGFDRGHEAPLHDQRGDAIDRCCLLSNIAPQDPHLNRGAWQRLEAHVRNLVKAPRSEVWVFTVPLWMPLDTPAQGDIEDDRFTVRVIGPNHVWVPTHFAKIVLLQKDTQREMTAWLYENSSQQKSDIRDDLIVPATLIQHWSGFDFFANLDDEEEQRLETGVR